MNFTGIYHLTDTLLAKPSFPGFIPGFIQPFQISEQIQAAAFWKWAGKPVVFSLIPNVRGIAHWDQAWSANMPVRVLISVAWFIGLLSLEGSFWTTKIRKIMGSLTAKTFFSWLWKFQISHVLWWSFFILRLFRQFITRLLFLDSCTD